MSFLSTTLTGYSFLSFFVQIFFSEILRVYSFASLKSTLDFVSFCEQFFVRPLVDFEI